MEKNTQSLIQLASQLNYKVEFNNSINFITVFAAQSAIGKGLKPMKHRINLRTKYFEHNLMVGN